MRDRPDADRTEPAERADATPAAEPVTPAEQPDAPRPVTAPLQEIAVTIGFGLMAVGALVVLVVDPSWWRAVTLLCFAATVPVARAVVRGRAAAPAASAPTTSTTDAPHAPAPRGSAPHAPAPRGSGTLLPLDAFALVVIGLASVRLASG